MTRKRTQKTAFLDFLLILLWIPAGLFAQTTEKLTGTPIGSTNWDYGTSAPSETVNTPAHAFDGDYETFYASQDRSRTWVGLDLGEPHVITYVGWCPRNSGNGPARTMLGLFEGANREDFLDAVPLHLITTEAATKKMTYKKVDVTRAFRYVRYVGPNDARCNIADLAFRGYKDAGYDGHFYQVTNLPTVSIHTKTGKDPADKVTEVPANITITYHNGTRIQESELTIRGRGNASWGFPKKPYRIKFTESQRVFKGSPLETPAKAKKWTLINNYGDKTLMRNIVAFEISKRLGMPYTPYCQAVDVILNGEYKGCYQLCDQITIDKNRVNITEMLPTDVDDVTITGGYLIEADAYAGNETNTFTSGKGIPFTIKHPDDDDIVGAQRRYIQNYFSKMEGRLWSTAYTDSLKGYRSMFDVETFLRHFIVGEFSGNTDTYWSTYIYKDREDNILHVGPVWDFDLAFNNDNRIYPVCNRADWIYRTGGSAANGMSGLVSRILSDPYTNLRLKEIWAEMRKNGKFSDESLLAFVDSISAEIDESQKLNFMRWPILNQTVHQNVAARGSYEAELQVIKDYLPERINWIDEYLKFDPNAVVKDSTYYISTAKQLVEFANAVNAGAVNSNAYLITDINMTAYNSIFKPIGMGVNAFAGTFDGQGHVINNLKIESQDNNVGLFGIVAGGAVIRNFVLSENSSISGGDYVGIVGSSTGAGLITIEKVGNEANITGTGRNVAGIIGCNMGSTCQFFISNCYNTGTIKGAMESGAISGWVGNNAMIDNCWNIGIVEGIDEGSDMLRYSGNLTMNNCYSTTGTQAEIVSEEVVKSGELCYKLNGEQSEEVIWYQKIGTDAHPVFSKKSPIVYKAEDGTYYNQSQLKGDVNGDGVVDVADLDAEVEYVMGQVPSVFITANADIYKDNTINVYDVAGLVNMVNGKGTSYTKDSSKEAYLYSSNASLKAGGTSRPINLFLKSSEPLTACQVEFIFSEGLSLDMESLTPGALATESHIIKSGEVNGRTRLLIYSPQNADFKGSSGVVLTFKVKALNTATSGTFKLTNQGVIAASGNLYSHGQEEYNVTVSGTVDGIIDTVDDLEEQEIYTVTGVRLDKVTSSGIYIINGRKVQVRINKEK